MKEGVAKSIVQPKILMERVLAQLEPLMADDPAKNVLFGPLQMIPADLATADKDKLTADYTAAIRQVMLPAYARLHAYIKADYLPHCRDTAGIGTLPGGKEAYASSVRWQTTTGLTPEQIHEIGLREVTRIKGEMEKIRVRVGFKGTLPEFLKFVASDPFVLTLPERRGGAGCLPRDRGPHHGAGPEILRLPAAHEVRGAGHGEIPRSHRRS